MIGLELHTDKQVVSASLADGSIHAIVDVIRNKSNLVLTGLDHNTEEGIVWYKKELEIGNEFILKIVDVKKNSIPIERRPKMSKKALTERKLKHYKALKKELEELDLI